MDRASSLEAVEYYCECQDIYMTRDQLQDHLQLRLKHKISKKSPASRPPEDFKKSILKKIEAIARIQAEVHQSSANLVKTITLNSQNAVEQLVETVPLCE